MKKIFVAIINGKVMYSISLDDTNDYLVVPVTDLPSGGYLCSMIKNNQLLQSERFIIVK